jgi:hypothetical protein
LKDIFDMAGMDLPSYLGNSRKPETNNITEATEKE